MHAAAEDPKQPVVVIFYLGAGCLHCVEQVQAILARRNDLQNAGIATVAISTESVAQLADSVRRFSKEGTFPIPLFSDESLKTFKQFHAFDDFENVALHATYLIDGSGFIRWHDIGAEPFMNVDFLLEESKRLLEPNRITMPTELPLPDRNQPADALNPANVFPAVKETTPKVVEPKVAATND